MAPRLDHPLIYWLLTEARRIIEPKAFLAGLAERCFCMASRCRG
jgi:hypothetical protein